MMKCGHAANAKYKDGDEWQPSCAICVGIAPGATEVDETPPDLTGRTARCSYYGSTPRPRGSSREGPCGRTDPCLCERPSDDDSGRLAFFGHKPDKPHDQFYCGCWGWD